MISRLSMLVRRKKEKEQQYVAVGTVRMLIEVLTHSLYTTESQALTTTSTEES